MTEATKLAEMTKDQLIKIVDQLQDEKKEQAKKDNASVYERLSKVDVSKFVDKKNGLNYLSWAKAWGLVKSIFPDASYKLREYPYYTQTADGNYQQIGTHDYLRTEYGVEVEASVTIKGETYSSKLYVMDFHNRALDPKKVTYFEINKTQMRALTKALAFAGLGLNIYAGEDLPSNEDETAKKSSKPVKKPRNRREELNQATQKIKDHATKTPINKWTKQQLENYQIRFRNGDLMTMKRLMNGISNEEPGIQAKAKEVSNSLTGESMDVFQALLKKQ